MSYKYERVQGTRLYFQSLVSLLSITTLKKKTLTTHKQEENTPKPANQHHPNNTWQKQSLEALCNAHAFPVGWKVGNHRHFSC